MRHPLGLKVPADYQITTYEPCRELALETTSGGPVHPTQRYELTRTPDGGTILRSVIEYQAQGLVRFARPHSPSCTRCSHRRRHGSTRHETQSALARQRQADTHIDAMRQPHLTHAWLGSENHEYAGYLPDRQHSRATGR